MAAAAAAKRSDVYRCFRTNDAKGRRRTDSTESTRECQEFLVARLRNLRWPWSDEVGE